MNYPEPRPETIYQTGAPLLAWDHTARAWIPLPAEMPRWEQEHEHHYTLHERIEERWERRLGEFVNETNPHRRRDLHRRICRLGAMWWAAWHKAFEVVL
jgi:hypothetical protein